MWSEDGPPGISDRRPGGRSWCGHLREAGPPRVRSGGRLGLGPQAWHEAGATVPEGVLKGAANTTRLAAGATPLRGGCAAATAAGGRSEGDTVAPSRKPGLPQPGPRLGLPGCRTRLSLPRRPLPTPTCSGVDTPVESTVAPQGKLSRAVRQGRGEQELQASGQALFGATPEMRAGERRRRCNGIRAVRGWEWPRESRLGRVGR